MKTAFLSISFLLWLFLLQANNNQRLIILADMGNEPDEEQQMIHMLVCSNEFDLEGLIAVSGLALHAGYKDTYKGVLHPELFHRLIDAYAEIYPNLQQHANGWHSPDYLRSIVSTGQEGYGVGDIGEGRSSPGSRLIIESLEKADPRPVFIVINAGSNTLAQALFDYRATHSESETAAIVSKLRVFENAAQDDAGAWINHEFPDIHWIRSVHQTKCFGGPQFDDLGPHSWKPFAYSTKGQDDWASEHIRKDHGALGALYPTRAYNHYTLEAPNFIEGGGTIPWLTLVPHGLTNPSETSWGGWSGRYTKTKILNVPARWKKVQEGEAQFKPWYVYTDTIDYWKEPETGKVYHDVHTPVLRWRQAMWNNLQARMDWCVKSYENANHHPIAVLNGDYSDKILFINAKPNERITIDASDSKDPDEDQLIFKWWIYVEAGTYPGQINISDPDKDKTTIAIPKNAGGKQIHLILEVKDDSKIASLFDYRRIVIDVEDK